jgi:hypothetical protein
LNVRGCDPAGGTATHQTHGDRDADQHKCGQRSRHDWHKPCQLCPRIIVIVIVNISMIIIVIVIIIAVVS